MTDPAHHPGTTTPDMAAYTRDHTDDLRDLQDRENERTGIEMVPPGVRRHYTNERNT